MINLSTIGQNLLESHDVTIPLQSIGNQALNRRKVDHHNKLRMSILFVIMCISRDQSMYANSIKANSSKLDVAGNLSTPNRN